jgi:hypothetical protein
MPERPTARALPLIAAAERLGVTTQRVIQLLDDDSLSGPYYSGRAPKNAPRVWESSIVEYEQGDHKRAKDMRRSPRALARTLDERDAVIARLQKRLSDSDESTTRELRFELGAVRAAAQILNVESDVMAEQLEKLHDEIAALKRTLGQRELDIASLQSRYDLVRSMLDAKSSALTQLLSPHSAPESPPP